MPMNVMPINCPVKESVRGRRLFSIPGSGVTSDSGVSYRTILRRRHKYGLPVKNTS